MNKKSVYIGGILLFCGLYLAFFIHSTIWYGLFIIGGFLLFDGINVSKGFSVLRYPRNLLKVWVYFIAITIVVELIGKWWLNLWLYPSFSIPDYLLHVLLIGYSFTGFFGLEFFVWLQSIFDSKKLQIVILAASAFIFGYINEYPNLFAHEWR